MTIGQLLVTSVSGFFLVTLPCEAGPCSEDITRMQTNIDTKLKAEAAAEPSQKQGAGAQLHRQPTPLSMAEAEGKTGAVSASTIKNVRGAMDRARKADAAGDKAACASALDDVGRLISAK